MTETIYYISKEAYYTRGLFNNLENTINLEL